jgi:dihydrodipicolinate synthase/N-acetylneuraminate lyase
VQEDNHQDAALLAKAAKTAGADGYVAASKIWFKPSLSLCNHSLRADSRTVQA